MHVPSHSLKISPSTEFSLSNGEPSQEEKREVDKRNVSSGGGMKRVESSLSLQSNVSGSKVSKHEQELRYVREIFLTFSKEKSLSLRSLPSEKLECRFTF